jgi:hypothetical protein
MIFGLRENEIELPLEQLSVQSAILLTLKDRQRGSVISTNHVIKKVRMHCHDCGISDKKLSKLICEAAMLLGIIPVYDPNHPNN